MCQFDLLNGLTDGIVDVVLARGVRSQGADKADEEGIDARKWVTIREFIGMVGEGGITTPPSASFFLYLNHAGYINSQ